MLPETDFHPKLGKPHSEHPFRDSFSLRFSGSLAAGSQSFCVFSFFLARALANVAKICHNICYTFSGQFFIATGDSTVLDSA